MFELIGSCFSTGSDRNLMVKTSFCSEFGLGLANANFRAEKFRRLRDKRKSASSVAKSTWEYSTVRLSCESAHVSCQEPTHPQRTKNLIVSRRPVYRRTCIAAPRLPVPRRLLARHCLLCLLPEQAHRRPAASCCLANESHECQQP